MTRMSSYDDRVYSKRLLGLTSRCPECGETLRATGYLNHRRLGNYPWYIEYECPEEGIVFNKQNIELQPLVDEIVRDAGKK